MIAQPEHTKGNGRDPGHARWAGITRPYDEAQVDRLRPSLRVVHTLAEHGATKLWSLLHSEEYVSA
jgi:isocitrate lyase